MNARVSPILDASGRPIVTNSYEGAGRGPRTNGFSAPAGGPNASLLSGLVNLRNRSRAGHRNNPWIFKAIESLVTNEVGTGIIPRSTHKDTDTRKMVNERWKIAADCFDPEGVLGFYGMQTQAVRGRRVACEVFIRRRIRRTDRFKTPLQIQILESEYVPIEKNEILPNGNKIVCGIEFNRRGQRVAYYMWTDHPLEARGSNNRLIRVPARDVIHHYMPTRPGQVRGEPDAAQSLLKAYTFDSYDDAELVRKQTRAPFTGFLQQTRTPDQSQWNFNPMTGQPEKSTPGSIPELDATPGTILMGMPGEELKLFDGDKAEGYGEFMRQQLLGIAGGFNIPYELVSGDWKDVNDRLVRAILNEFRRYIESCQDHLTTFQMCMGVWRWWMDAEVAYNGMPLPNYSSRRDEHMAVEWRPQAWKYLHPEQDVNAKLTSIKGGLSSRDAEVAASGWDREEVDLQNVEAEAELLAMRRIAGLPDYPVNEKQTGNQPQPEQVED
jgi:lambda family phage portal protein